MSTAQFLHCKLSMAIGSARPYVEGFMYDVLLYIYQGGGGGAGIRVGSNISDIQLIYRSRWH